MNTINDVMIMDISALECSVRSSHCMKNMNIQTVSDLTSKSENDLFKAKNFGKKSMEEIKNKLEKWGLSFNMTNYDWLHWGINHIELIKRL